MRDVSSEIDPNLSALNPDGGSTGNQGRGSVSAEALAAAAPTAEDPSPEMMVVVNDCHRTTFLVDAGAQISTVDKDTCRVTNPLPTAAPLPHNNLVNIPRYKLTFRC